MKGQTECRDRVNLVHRGSTLGSSALGVLSVVLVTSESKEQISLLTRIIRDVTIQRE